MTYRKVLLAAIVATSSVACSPGPTPSTAELSSGGLDDPPSLATKACVEGSVSCCLECAGGQWVSMCGPDEKCSSCQCVLDTTKKPLGSSCSSASGCISGNCVNNICCGVASCPGDCNFCGSTGACAVKTGVTPKTCALSTAAPCGAGCFGSVNCTYRAAGTGSCSSSQCVGSKAAGYSWITGATTCNGSGGCNTPTTGGTNCGLYVCSSGCKTTCSTSVDCIDTAYCSSSVCVPKVGLGVECPLTDACSTGAGSCAPSADGKQRCCSESCTSPKACSIDGTACVGTTAFGESCAADDQCVTGKCAGSKCVFCKIDGDCSPADYCDTATGKCNIRQGVGATCDTVATCPSGTSCTDGVCCVASTCSPGGTCAGVKKGACAKLNGATCSSDLDCDSGKCVDKVCCDSACDKQCEACNIDGSLGKCVAVKGAPVGLRPSCSSGDGNNPCTKASCDGALRDRCAALAGSEQPCRTASCVDGTATGAATCNGSGMCPEPVKAVCGAYQCGMDAVCRTSCSQDTDCAGGNVCRNAQCEPRTAQCSDAVTSVSREGTTKPCSPFLCDTSSGNCFVGCTSSDQCAPGNLCADGVCTVGAQDAGTGEDGGCSTSPRERGTSPWWILALAAFVGSRRRNAGSR